MRIIAIALVWLALALPCQAQMTTLGAGGTKAATASGWCNLIPQSGLVNCWPFDTANTSGSTATDVIGGKNATLTSVTLNGSGPTTHLNNAGVFNGSSSHGDTTLANLPTAAFSLVIWINVPTIPFAAEGYAMANDQTIQLDNKGFELLTANAASTVPLWIGNGTSSQNAVVSSPTITASTWENLAWTWDGSSFKAYLNASLGATSSFTGPIAAPTNNISFGFNPASSSHFFNGKIAGVAIYNRALSSGEVTTINGL